MSKIRVEIARVTSHTYKTEKAALGRVERDTAWAASFDGQSRHLGLVPDGTWLEHTVEITSRWDADLQRTLHDVDFVTYRLVDPTEVPEGAQGQVSGARVDHLGKRIPYGYSARVIGLHESGRLKVLNYTGTLVVREDEVLTLLRGTALQPSRLQEGTYADEPLVITSAGTLRNGVLTVVLPEGDEITDTRTDGERAGWEEAQAEQDASQLDDAVLETAWFTIVWGGSAGDSSEQVQGWTATLDTVHRALEADVQGTVDVKILTDHGNVVYDIAEHDSCSVHHAVFSKEIGCPLCSACDACGAPAGEPCYPGCLGVAKAQDDAQEALQERTVATLRDLHERLTGYTPYGITVQHLAAVQTAIDVLEG